MRVLVVGAGATGGYFGGRLADAGRDVTFLVRPKRAAQLGADGLQIVSEHGDLTIAPRLVVPGEVGGGYGLVLLAVKSYALARAIEDFAPAVGPDTLILPFLNGMAHIDVLSARFGTGRVLGGTCIVAATLDETGRVLQLAGFQAIGYGDRADPESAGVRALDPVLQGAGFDARRSAEIDLEMWGKWVALAALGATTCLMRGTVGQVMAAPGGQRFTEDVLAECAAVAAASGYPMRAASLDWMRARMTEAGSSFASSMYRDLIAGGPIEADQIIGDFAARGRAAGVPVPLLSLAYTHLSVYQQSLA
ncbi:MAG TPA: ketopantoate reductase family protein [Streptosporangiaceae bacterium]